MTCEGMSFLNGFDSETPQKLWDILADARQVCDTGQGIQSLLILKVYIHVFYYQYFHSILISRHKVILWSIKYNQVADRLPCTVLADSPCIYNKVPTCAQESPNNSLCDPIYDDPPIEARQHPVVYKPLNLRDSNPQKLIIPNRLGRLVQTPCPTQSLYCLVCFWY